MDELNEKENVKTDTNNDSVIQEQPSGSYLLGALGALLGGFVAAIPWIFVYIFGNMIFSALAILIAIGALKGYQLFKGKIDKKLPVILTITSLLVVVITTLVIIPFAMLAHEGFTLSFEYFRRLYAIEGFWADITHDLIISIVFAALGISGVVANVNKQVKSSEVPLDKININDTLTNQTLENTYKEAYTSIKNIFERYNATDKDHAIDNATVQSELEQINDGKQVFNLMKSQQMIRKTKGKFYFSEKTEQTINNRYSTQPKRTMIILVIIVALALAVGILNNNTNTNNDTNTMDLESTQETPYVSEHFGMKLVVPKNMSYLIGDSLDYAFGAGASSFYEFAAYRSNALESDMITCFIMDIKESEVKSYLESVKESFVQDDYIVVNDFQEQTISGFNFTTFEFQITSEGILYNDLCLVYFKDGKLIGIEYSFLSADRERIMKNIDKMILQNN